MFLLTFPASANSAEQGHLITAPHLFDVAGWSGGWSVWWGSGMVGGSSGSSLGLVGVAQMGGYVQMGGHEVGAVGGEHQSGGCGRGWTDGCD